MVRLKVFIKSALPLVAAAMCWAQSQPVRADSVRLTVDASEAPRRLLHANMQFPVKPGPMSLLYPKWIPGEHGPTGPIEDLAGIRMTANGQPVPWHRDDVNVFEFHIDIPAGVSELDVAIDFISPPDTGGFSAG